MRSGEWPGYGGDTGHTRYSPLDQIDGSNFSELEIAWRFKIDNLGPAPEFKLEGTPLMAGGVLYATGGTRRAAVALDAATGTRGAGFGEDGSVDLKAAAVVGDGRPIDLVTGETGLHATPTVARNVAIAGGTFAAAPGPRTHNNTKGLVQAFDTAARPVRAAAALSPRSGWAHFALVTRTLVVIGECGYHRTAAGRGGAGRGAMLRAYDKATGQEVGAVFMPAPQSGSPMTYVAGGPAVHRARRQRPHLLGRVHRLPPAVIGKRKQKLRHRARRGRAGHPGPARTPLSVLDSGGSAPTMAG